MQYQIAVQTTKNVERWIEVSGEKRRSQKVHNVEFDQVAE